MSDYSKMTKEDCDAWRKYYTENLNNNDGWDRFEAEAELRHMAHDLWKVSLTEDEKFMDMERQRRYTQSQSGKRRSRRKIWKRFNQNS